VSAVAAFSGCRPGGEAPDERVLSNGLPTDGQVLTDGVFDEDRPNGEASKNRALNGCVFNGSRPDGRAFNDGTEPPFLARLSTRA
jgi:hypothetical protein